MCRNVEPSREARRSSPERSPHSPFGRAPTGFSKLIDDSDDDTIGLETASAAGTSVFAGEASAPEISTFAEASSGGWLAELMGGILTLVVTIVLNVTYAGVIMGSTPLLRPYLSYGIAMCLGCTALSNMWLLVARRNMPFVTVADSFMAVLFATTASNLVRQAPEGSSILGTLVVAMFLCSLMLSAGYIATGVLRVCNVVQFVPSPVMAGYQASIGYLLLDSAATLASGCSLLQPACLADPAKAAQLVLAASLGITLFVAQQKMKGVARILVLPAMLGLTTLLFQGATVLATLPGWTAWHGIELSGWTMELPATQSILSLPADLGFSNICWRLALNEALLAAVTAFVPNLLGKLLQCAASGRHRVPLIASEWRRRPL